MITISEAKRIAKDWVGPTVGPVLDVRSLFPKEFIEYTLAGTWQQYDTIDESRSHSAVACFFDLSLAT
jgi:hypothetical protein